MQVIFVVFDEELEVFFGDVPDSQPETLRGILDNEGCNPEYVQEIFIVEGDLTSLGRDYI